MKTRGCIEKISLFLKETGDFCRFFWKIPQSDKKIVFYSEHEGYFPYFEGCVNALVFEYKQTFCYVTSDPDDPILQKHEPGIIPLYLNSLLAFFMLFVDSQAFVLTLTDLNQFHLKRSLNPSVCYIYLFHSLCSTHMKFRFGAYDYYDYLLCVGPYHGKEIRKHEEVYHLPSKKLLEGGYYRLERIYDAYRKYVSKNLSSAQRKTVLIAPSWGKSNVLESCGKELVRILLSADYEVIVRPHPETVRHCPDLINSLADLFGTNPHFTLERSVATDDSLLRADILICDSSGVALEYAFGTERPVLFLDVPVQINNPRFKELDIEPLEISLRSKIGIVLSSEKLSEAPGIISQLIAKQGEYKKRLEALREENIYSFGKSSEIAARCVMDVLNGSGTKEK